MPKAKPKFYVTTSAYDALAGPTAGYLYGAVLADAIARHRRMCGFDVAHALSIDAHGERAETTADRPPQKPADLIRRHIGQLDDVLRIGDVHPTHFERTGSARHTAAVTAFLARIEQHSRLSIYKARYEGRYCPSDHVDVSTSVEPADCPICGRAAQLVSEERYLFRMSTFRERLEALYQYRPEFVQPRSRLDDVVRFIAAGLKDVPISQRPLEPGIPWPGDPDHIVAAPYMGLVCHLSAIGFGEGRYGSDEFKNYWPANLHVGGSSALLPQAVLWPAALMAAELPLPRHVFAHGTVRGATGTSDRAFLDDPRATTAGSDAIRYYLLRDVGHGEDATVDYEAFVRRHDADLADRLWKLSARIIDLVERHCAGRVPVRSLLGRGDPAIASASNDTRARVRFVLDGFDFGAAIECVSTLLAGIDRHLPDAPPVESTGDPAAREGFTDVLHDACEGLGVIALLLHPVMPHATAAIWRSLGQTAPIEDQLVDETPSSFVIPGTRVVALEPLFRRLDTSERRPC